jgi:hypothetical protein
MFKKVALLGVILLIGGLMYVPAALTMGAGGDDPPPTPTSTPPSTVVIDGCDTGIDNVEYVGLPISELIDGFASSAGNHGQFVSSVSNLANNLLKEGLITSQERGVIQSCAAKADLP